MNTLTAIYRAIHGSNIDFVFTMLAAAYAALTHALHSVRQCLKFLTFIRRQIAREVTELTLAWRELKRSPDARDHRRRRSAPTESVSATSPLTARRPAD